MNPTFRLGPDPYPHREGDGTWSGRFPDAETALRALLPTFAYPGRLSGRKDDVFIEGVSLPGVPAHEVIQLWSTDPAIAKRSQAYGRKHKLLDLHPSWPGHIGDGTSAGLALEIRVQEIARYLKPVFIDRALPAGASNQTTISPLGASLGDVLALRSRAALELTNSKMEIQRSRFQMQLAKKALEERNKLIEDKLAVANAYISGAGDIQCLVKGRTAPASLPYTVYQSRIHLDTELGLLANLVDLDWTSMADIDRWLVDSGAWKRLLPAEKAVIVSRIRTRDLQYQGRSAIEAAIYNHLNRATIIWIRDGESLWRFTSEIPAGKRLFPAAGELDRLIGAVQEAIWQSEYRPREEKEDDKPGLAKHPEKAKKPYVFSRQAAVKFGKLEEWLHSPYYTAELDAYIRDSASAALADWSRKNLPFVVMLQGVVDRGGMLNVPPGTNLFEPEVLARYFTLVSDYSLGLPDEQSIRRFEAAAKQVQVGDMVIAPALKRVGERWESYVKENPSDLRFYRVTAMKNGQPVVRRSIPSKRYDSFLKCFTKEPTSKLRADVPSSFMPLKLPKDLIATLLHHRDWKIKNEAIVPLLGQWDAVRSQAKNAANGSRVELRVLHMSTLNSLKE